MDISKEYIEACKKAEKIQYKHKYKEGDWFCWPGKGVVCLGHYVPIWENIVTPGGYDYDFQDIDYSNCIWLPRQDQLQEITGTISILILLDDFHKFLDSDYYSVKCPGFYFNSIEQLWLAFVMKKKYNKIWTNKEWV